MRRNRHGSRANHLHRRVLRKRSPAAGTYSSSNHDMRIRRIQEREIQCRHSRIHLDTSVVDSKGSTHLHRSLARRRLCLQSSLHPIGLSPPDYPERRRDLRPARTKGDEARLVAMRQSISRPHLGGLGLGANLHHVPVVTFGRVTTKLSPTRPRHLWRGCRPRFCVRGVAKRSCIVDHARDGCCCFSVGVP